MAYEKLEGLSSDNTYALGKVNAKTGKTINQVEGYYLGARTVPTSAGDSVLHYFQTPNGNDAIWGSKTLNDTLTKNVVGFMILVKYLGKVKRPGGKTQHTYDIGIDRSNQIEVSSSPSGFGDDSDDDGGETTYTNGADEDAAQDLAVAAAARKAKLDAALNKGKR